MKILVIGAGSIGSRHAENAQKIADEAGIFDLDPDKKNSLAEKLGIKTFDSLQDALEWCPDGVVIATPHKTHIKIAQTVIDAGIDVLIEKPISHESDGVEAFLKNVEKQKRNAYVVCNMRFHPAIKILHQNLSKIGDIYYARAQYGNYLPNMRPDADYKKLYCAHKEQGGGVIFDAIHEVDYLSWLFEEVETVSCETDKRSDLDIDVEDYAAMVLKHKNGVRTEIHMDYLQTIKQRGCEIIGTKGTLIWQSYGKKPENCLVKYFDAENGRWKDIINDKKLDASSMYYELMEKFISALSDNGNNHGLLTAKEAFTALRVSLTAHKSAEIGKRITMDKAK